LKSLRPETHFLRSMCVTYTERLPVTNFLVSIVHAIRGYVALWPLWFVVL